MMGSPMVFHAGWGGAVWKTIGEPIMKVRSRYSSVDWNGQRMMGLNNIELISDRPIETNLREIAEVKKRYPKHAVVAFSEDQPVDLEAVERVRAGARSEDTGDPHEPENGEQRLLPRGGVAVGAPRHIAGPVLSDSAVLKVARDADARTRTIWYVDPNRE